MKKLIAVVLIILSLALSWFYLSATYSNTSPLKSSVYFLEHLFKPHAKMQKVTYGFLPYWQVRAVDNIRLDLLTDIDYFGLVANDEGDFVKVTNGQTDPGYREWESQEVKDLITRTQIMGGRFSVTIVSQNNDTIETILDDSSTQEKLIANILNEVKIRKLDGVNIDFEYLGEPDVEYQQKFTDFSKKLSSILRRESPQVKLSLSIMPRSARDNDLFDFPKLAPLYENFIGMSYDYSGISSEIATATAPMNGYKENKFFFDVSTTYEDYLKVIPKEKIIMGVPHYGWDWAVENGRTIQSPTLLGDHPDNYSAVISYGRARENKDLKKSQCEFDDYALQPWCWYIDPKTKVEHQVWYEDNKSIGIKYDFANKQDLSGIAIWVLGYDKDYPDLWDLMKEKFSTK